LETCEKTKFVKFVGPVFLHVSGLAFLNCNDDCTTAMSISQFVCLSASEASEMFITINSLLSTSQYFNRDESS